MLFFLLKLYLWVIYVFPLPTMRTFECYIDSSLKRGRKIPPQFFFFFFFSPLFTNRGTNLLPNPWLLTGPSRKRYVVTEVLGETHLFWGYWGAKLHVRLQGLPWARIRKHPRDGSAAKPTRLS